jgi:sec-independent protein translocase protein TatB
MFGIDSAELLIVALVALVVIGPKDLPRVMRTVGHWVGKARGMASHFRSGFDTMVREAELEEMEKKWKAENERIMREHPMPPPAEPGALPPPAAADSGPLPPPGEAYPKPEDKPAAPPAPPRRAPPAPRRAAPPAPPRELP